MKKAFINYAPPYQVSTTPNDEGGMRRVFIPSLLEDNPSMLINDPTYENRLLGLGGKKAQAMRWGNWDIIEGAYFDEFEYKTHVLQAQSIPLEWQRIRSYDHGYAKPFSHGWTAVMDGETSFKRGDETITPPRGSLVRYREWYGADPKKDNEGVRLASERIARGIVLRQYAGEKFDWNVADRIFFNKNTGKSINETWINEGLIYTRVNDDRISGWDQFRSLLTPEKESGLPRYYVMETCLDAIRCIPNQMHSESKPEDLDSDLEDHVVDDIRYSVMARYRAKKKQAKTDSWKDSFIEQGEEWRNERYV